MRSIRCAAFLTLVASGTSWADITPADVPEEIPTFAIITLNDAHNSTYRISFLGVTGTTWSYHVEEIAGRSLSHWLAAIPCCLTEDLVSIDPDGQYGEDGSTGYLGIKWDLPESFSGGDFSFTLSRDYPLGTIDVLAKAGPHHATAPIVGPDCDSPPPSPMPAPGAALLGLAGLSTWAAIRRRLA